MSATSQARRVTTYDVYVGNLPPETDQKKVSKVFSKFGEVQNIWLTNASDGHKFGVVKFYCEEDSLKAIEETNGTLFEGGAPMVVKKWQRRGLSQKKEGDQELNSDSKDEIKQAMPLKQRNPDIGESAVPTFESHSGPNKRDVEKLLVSYVETPIIMWGQRMSQDNANELANILEQLAVVCPEAPKVVGKPENDKIYGAQYTEDGCWYRCTVRYTFSPDRVKVQYIDFGNTEELNPSTLVELPRSLTALPSCAMKFVLHSLWCNNNQDPVAIKYLKDLVEGKEVEAYTTARLSDHTGFFAEIYLDGTSINEKMLESGFAFKKPGLEQRNLKGRTQGVDGDAMGNSGPKGGLMNHRDGPRKFETEKDEISNLRWKLKNLQSEYTSLSNKAQENDLSGQIKNLQILSSAARKLRKQFPLDKETPLDEAIALVKSSCKIDINMAGSLPEVISAINAYKSAQDEILKCSDTAILKDKIESRNIFRKDLFDKLTITIEELNKVPLQERGTQVKDVVSALTKHYDTFAKIPIPNLPTVDSLLSSFEEWKERKKVEVIGARRTSDTLESSVSTVFDQLKFLISLSPDLEESEMSEDLDTALKNYTKAIQQEIAIADIENSPDAILIGSLVQVLLRELHEESCCVEHLSNVQREFTSLKMQISPWLNSSPTTDELDNVRSKLKSLKSKLRHKLADKMDAEENQDAVELETIAKDLIDIRSKIHKALKEEDKLMTELSQLANAHFPELINSESDSGFSTHLSYKGLVKLSHAPDHYKMTTVGNSSSGMFVSEFDGEPVFIKEYFLSNGSHLDKEGFLSQMALYTNASSTYLEPVSAVFFDKNNRHAYVQVKKQGELLSTLVENSILSKLQCQSIVKSLCMALQALNLFNFVHGQIQPEFITVDEEGNAKLLPPDFSLADTDRCRSRYTTSSGVEIISPEMKQSMIPVEPAHSVDIYCLGVLALWMHHPTVQFLERKEGTLDFSTVPLDRNLGIFLMKLMCPNPMLRPTAESCLRSEYLCQPPVTESPAVREQSPLVSATYGDMKNGQDPGAGRNSASPASIQSQNSSDGLVYAENGSGVQMIANTRVPPPPIAGGDNLAGNNQPYAASPAFSSSLPPSLQQPVSVVAPQQQVIQQHPQQYQLQRQLIQQQQQQQAQAASHEQDGAFEIGTFDPNAYEVVTSPQPINAVRPDENQEDAGAAASDSVVTTGDEFGTASDEGANDDDYKDVDDGGADGELDEEEVEDEDQ